MLHDWSVLTRTARDAPLALHLHISKTGGRFLCAGNGIAAAPYQRWPHRPRAFDADAK